MSDGGGTINTKDINDEIEIKAILLGNAGVGKTNLINTCTGEEFSENHLSTTTGGLRTKKFEINNKKYSLDLYDTAGQEIYRSVTKIFIKGAEIVIYVYDITSENSFRDIEEWIKITNDILQKEHISCIVGNKIDLFQNEKVDEDKARKYAREKDMRFALVSAKENPRDFELLLEDLIRDHNFLNESIMDDTKIKIIKTHQKKKKCCIGRD